MEHYQYQLLTAEEANRFAYHPPVNDTVKLAHESVRAKCLELAQFLTTVVPAGRHRSLTITAMQEAMMWANAGIACDYKTSISSGQ